MLLKKQIRQAFESVHDGYSADRVVADPDLNSKFLAACASLGIDAPAAVLNKALFNARKASLLAGVPTTRRTNLPDLEDCQFASEVAARFLEQRDQVTLDDILCDPTLAAEFDRLAAEISPRFSSLQYRWSALCLRKTKRLQPELATRMIPPVSVQIGRIDGIDLARIPNEQGIYVFYSQSETLYVGEAENLRLRIRKHLDHSDIKAVARRFWEKGTADVFLEISVLPPTTTSRIRKAMESAMIASRHASFNIKRQ